MNVWFYPIIKGKEHGTSKRSGAQKAFPIQGLFDLEEQRLPRLDPNDKSGRKE
jgi:hypothetical protein